MVRVRVRGLGHGLFYNPNKLLELLNVVTNNFIGLQRSDWLIV